MNGGTPRHRRRRAAPTEPAHMAQGARLTPYINTARTHLRHHSAHLTCATQINITPRPRVCRATATPAAPQPWKRHCIAET